MKKQIMSMALSCLILGTTIVSCKKEETTTPPPANSTTGTTSGNTPSNPLATKLCKGNAIITVDGVNDTLKAEEVLMNLGTSKYYTLMHTGESLNLDFFTGDNKLPATSKTFTINNNINDTPKIGEVFLSIYEGMGEDLYAQSGTVTYTIGTTEKVVKFTGVQFQSEDGTVSKTISYEAKLK